MAGARAGLGNEEVLVGERRRRGRIRARIRGAQGGRERTAGVFLIVRAGESLYMRGEQRITRSLIRL